MGAVPEAQERSRLLGAGEQGVEGGACRMGWGAGGEAQGERQPRRRL